MHIQFGINLNTGEGRQMRNRSSTFTAEDTLRIVCNTLLIIAPIALIAIGGSYALNTYTSFDPVLLNTLFATFSICTLGAPTVAILMIKNQEFKRLNQEILTVASTDALTQTLNRRAFTQQAERILSERDEQAVKTNVCFLSVDVDKFKHVNDQCGHVAGDEALQTIASALKLHLRPADLLGRLGGEEFGVFLNDTSTLKALQIAQAMRVAVTDIYFAPQGIPRPLSVSIGMSTAQGPNSFTELYLRADEQLYEAKRSGRNNVKACTISTTPVGYESTSIH
jgi:diguanylate cyclase